MSQRHLLVAIEGIDGVGKGTQARLLRERLLREGHPATLISFPCYDSFFGHMVADYLNGRFGGLDSIDPKLCALMYALDRSQHPQLAERMAATERQVIVLDRYVPSNLAHQAAKLTGTERRHLLDWMCELEYEVLGIPRPTLVIVLDAEVGLAGSQVLKKEQRSYTTEAKDIHEQNTDYLHAVRQVFLELSESDPTCRLIDCAPTGSMRPINDIAEEIWSIVSKLL